MSNDQDADLVQELVESFRSLLDEALIVAIANDHDLQKPSEYQSARAILQGLSQDVTSEEASGFNPSGIPVSPVEDLGPSNDNQSTTTASVSQPASQSHNTDSSGTEISHTPAENVFAIPRLTSFEGDSEDSKVAQLEAMFSELKAYDIKHSLKKVNGDFQAALDDLLNVQYLKSTGQQMKGVDGFFQPEARVAKKGKKRGKKLATSEEADASSDGFSATESTRTIKHQDQIAYLADLFDLPFAQVSDIYHRKRTSSGATAVEVLDQYISLGIEAQDETGKKHAEELAQRYRNVPERYMTTIVQVTGPISQFADDIAALLSKHFTKNPWTQKLDLSYRLTPLPQDDIEGSTVDTSNKAATSGKKLPSITAGAATSGSAMGLSQAVQLSNQYSQSRRDAMASAAHMNRKGASNPLYRQAAGYYAERAREQGRYAHQATSTAADLLVVQQSSGTTIDLHGVSVRDGARIARQRTQAWWDGLGEFRLRRAREQPFTVITGLGRHSAGGVSQMRQAVAAALLQDGWKIQVETGRFVVTGRR